MKKVRSKISPAFISVLSLFMPSLMACDYLGAMPAYPVEVIGFASTCGRGASAKIIFDTHPDRKIPNMYLEADDRTNGQETIEFVSMPRPTITSGPFVVKVGSFVCSFAQSNGMELEEVTCRLDDREGTGKACLARINLQGLRAPTLPPFDLQWQDLAEDKCPAILPEKMFAEVDAKKWRELELEQKDKSMRRSDSGECVTD